MPHLFINFGILSHEFVRRRTVRFVQRFIDPTVRTIASMTHKLTKTGSYRKRAPSRLCFMSFCIDVRPIIFLGEPEGDLEAIEIAGDLVRVKVGADNDASVEFDISFFGLILLGLLIIEVDVFLPFFRSLHSETPLPLSPELDVSGATPVSLSVRLSFLRALGLSYSGLSPRSLFMSLSRFISTDWILSRASFPLGRFRF